MSVLIKGMKMPKRCDECEFAQDDSWYGLHCTIQTDEDGWLMDVSSIETDRHLNCPLVELPPHGRLVDADVLNDMINRSYPMTDRVDVHNGYAICQEMIKQLPTIIEAEEVRNG